MGTFKQLQHKNRGTPTPATLMSSLPPFRPFAPLAAHTSEQVSPDWQAQLEHATRFGHSISRIPIFPVAEVGQPGRDGHPLPESIRQKMEGVFGRDFSHVRIHEEPHVASLGALAYTQGTDLHFAPGTYQPGSSAGQKLIGHELAHVVQQETGQVQPSSGGNISVNTDPVLENEAEVAGSRAAQGHTAGAIGRAVYASERGYSEQSSLPAQTQPIQMARIDGYDTEDPNDRQAISDYLQSLSAEDVEGRKQLEDFKKLLLNERNSTYGQYWYRFIDDLILYGQIPQSQSSGGRTTTFTSARIYVDDRFFEETPRRSSGESDETIYDQYGEKIAGQQRLVSQMDAEVKTLNDITETLERLKQERVGDQSMTQEDELSLFPSIRIEIAGSQGPCDQCSERIQDFVASYYNNPAFPYSQELIVNANYTQAPYTVSRGHQQQLQTNYGRANIPVSRDVLDRPYYQETHKTLAPSRSTQPSDTVLSPMPSPFYLHFQPSIFPLSEYQTGYQTPPFNPLASPVLTSLPPQTPTYPLSEYQTGYQTPTYPLSEYQTDYQTPPFNPLASPALISQPSQTLHPEQPLKKKRKRQ